MGVSAIARLPLAALNDPGSVGWLNRTSFAAGPNDDSCPMRFYFGQIPFLVIPGTVTHVNFMNSEPQQARFHLFSPDTSDAGAVVIKFFKRASNSLQVFASGVQVASFNDRYAGAGAGTAIPYPGFSDAHGASLFNPQARHVTFVLRGQAAWGVSPVDVFTLASVQLSLTVSVSASTFFDPKLVVGNLAQLLSIDPSRIKVVSVAAAPAQLLLRSRQLAEGTQQLDLEILPPPNSTRLSSPDSFNASASAPEGALATSPSGSLSSNPAAQATLVAASMASVASTISALYASGGLAVGYPVAALTVVAPPVIAVPGLAPVPASPTVTSNATASALSASQALSNGAVAGIVVAALVGALLIAIAALLLRKHCYEGRPAVKVMSTRPGVGGEGEEGRFEGAPPPGMPRDGAADGKTSDMRQPRSVPRVNIRMLNLPQLGTQEDGSEAGEAAAAGAAGAAAEAAPAASARPALEQEGQEPHARQARNAHPHASRLLLQPSAEDTIAAEAGASSPDSGSSSRTLPGALSAAKSRAHLAASTRTIAFKPEQTHQH